MYALWPGDSDAVVATTDLIVAVATALLLLALGRAGWVNRSPARSKAARGAAALPRCCSCSTRIPR